MITIVNKRSQFLCILWWNKLRTLNIKSAVKDYDVINQISTDKMIYFLQLKAYNVEHLSFQMAPFYLTMSSLIRISSVCENIKSLDFTQIPSKFSSLDASFVLALPFFKNLQELYLELELPVVVVGGKCLHRNVDFPFHQLSLNLIKFSFIGSGVSVTKMLQTMREKGQKLNNLENLELEIRLCIPNLIEELAWFLDFHPNLKFLLLENLMFASMAQILMFLRVIQRHSSLSVIKLNNSSCCELIDNKNMREIFNQLQAQNIQIEADIFNLTFDSNNNNNNV
uniref:Uncharacterized protein n=1 Tax=Panagrolaimus sp. PS1159 TaxID=55785 RepID=A0AC35G8N0_9BILA